MTQSQNQINLPQPETSESIIIAQDVEKWYDNNFHALKGVTLNVKNKKW